ncbi:MAG: methyltransferase, partial [Gammaproteobacteria bacterium]|nr:methyltransferase [Gammaproteobacteria bacterium]NIQ74027.1 methyltransferase [Gammaproteobacteria bacterium]NIR94808.1 methyltransferase [Gammaproteobacteria bacterium]NIW47316.1 methyltransferase [Gammaproteobacteria bacterium]NIX58269.1 methyltransferase [candidate division Zixibacteria bacterium]
ALSELLVQFGAIAVSLSALSDEHLFDSNSAQTDDLWIETRISALLYEDTDLDTLLPLIRKRIGDEHIRNYSIDSLADKNWVGEYRQNHQARIFANRLCVCPDWLEPPANVEQILWLDPGLAFGTGSHETTGLCLDWLAKQTLENKIVVDYGCGSGILALSALKLGADHVYATDIDSQALAATIANAEKNHLTANLVTGLPDTMQFPEADLLLANI